MEPRKVTATLSLLVVGAFVLTTTLVTLAPVLTGKPPETYNELLKDYWSLFSGIMGLIIGFYFGKGNSSTQP